MSFHKDLSGNGKGVTVDPNSSAIDLSTTDAVLPIRTRRVRVTGAGNVIYRPAGGDSDITIAALAGEHLFISSGATIRRTGTTATGLTAHNY